MEEEVPVKKKGRPMKWTDELLEIEAEYLREWAKRNDALVMGTCYGERGYSSHMSRVFSERHPYYAECKDIAMTIVGARRELGALIGKLDGAIVRASMGNYDFDYRQYLEEMKRSAIEAELAEEVEIKNKLFDMVKAQAAVSTGSDVG